MIRDDCAIEKPSEPPNGEKLCWEPTCRSPLPPRAQKWCAKHKDGAYLWLANHLWDFARRAVIEAACTRVHEPDWNSVVKHRPWLTGERASGWEKLACYPACSKCGKVLKPPEAPEVDHIEPMNGDSRSGEDCRHHQDNLRVLCHDCHAKRTADQAALRAADRRGQQVLDGVFAATQENR